MRYRLATAAFALACLAASPAVSQTYETYGAGPPMVSADQARDIAAFNGVVIIRKLELDDGLWRIEGRDRSDRRVEMKINPRTGEIAELERFD